MSICQIAFAIAQIAFVDVAASHKNEWAGYVLSKQGEREREREREFRVLSDPGRLTLPNCKLSQK